MRARIPLVLACVALVAVACQDTPTEPVEQPVATVPDFNFMNGPASPGNSDIERYSEAYKFNFSADLYGSRWLLVTYDVWRAYAECTLTFPDAALMEPWDIQQKERMTLDGVRMTELMQREDVVYIVDHLIYDQSEYDWNTEVCPWLMASWNYRGTAKFVVHQEYLDGDFERRMASANGFVEDPEGNLYRFHYKERVDGPDVYDKDVFELEFTPIGKK
ncbi:MAG: hypothetical protein M8835_06760 [marine benthic group bacterium]|nr:hypothetical protein [Gemmatimonadota bacterium]